MKVISGLLLVAASFAAGEIVQCPPEQFTNSEMVKFLPHEYCDRFYKCSLGVPIVLQCPKDLYFNIELSVCDWKRAVDCTGRKVNIDILDIEDHDNSTPATDENELTTPYERETDVTDSTDEIEFLDNGCPVNPEIHWLVPNEGNCSLFYSCVWGDLVELKCPDYLHFNRIEQVCDYPERAGCFRTFEKLQQLQITMRK
ncbi:unnamed protein product [Leptidea sinapis]|uniref:Chitin-binding type-2 domain-containing protein n=1 Tax=Leptidea sinapis TaxID=189913 RepID=A0A5E4R3W6_9NEOP|nr:unnamed protein product [Leptidea sinapis]